MTIEYLKCNFRVKYIFSKVPSRGVKVGKSQKLKCFKVPLVGTLNLCLEMPDSMKKVWAQSDQCEPRNHWKFAVLTISNIFAHFGRFLRTGWSDWAQTFSIKSGISRHKFRVPTRGTLKHFEISIFLTLSPFDPSWGDLRKNIFDSKIAF